MEFAPRRVRRLTCALVATAATFAAAAPPAPAHVTEQEAQDAVADTVAWFRAEQAADGSLGFFGGDWAMIALANAGVNAADLSATPADPSLQDYFHASWIAFPLRDSATGVERGLLTGRGGGIQGARLDAANNLVADLATYYDGSQVGNAAQVNDDMFALLATEREGAIREIAPALVQELRSTQDGGGWNYTGSGAPDADVTASGIAALCAGGATASDPAVQDGLDYLESMQDDATGGFVSDFFGVNTDTTAWTVNALRGCGVDPQGPRWTTELGKTPLDYLLAVQKDDGSFRWQPGELETDPDNLYATQDAVTALVGEGFGAEPAPRNGPGEPVVRPAPMVADGTLVPMTLVIDHGTGVAGAERACLVEAPVGASADALMAAAASGATNPAGCATNLQRSGGQVTSVNRIDAVPGTSWQVSVDGGAASTSLGAAIQLGSTVALTLTGTPSDGRPQPRTPLPPVDVERPAPRLKAKAALGRSRTLRLRGRAVRIAVRCPRGLGAVGCRGELRVSYKAKGRFRRAGSRSFQVASGQRKVVRVKLGRKLRKLVKRRKAGRIVRVEALVRDAETLAVTRTRLRARLRD